MFIKKYAPVWTIQNLFFFTYLPNEYLEESVGGKVKGEQNSRKIVLFSKPCVDIKSSKFRFIILILVLNNFDFIRENGHFSKNSEYFRITARQ